MPKSCYKTSDEPQLISVAPTDAGWQADFVGVPPGPNERHVPYCLRAIKADWRELASVAGGEMEPLDRAHIEVDFYRKRLGVADEDNDRCRLKPIIDGLVDAGVLRNDTRGYIKWGTVREVRGNPGFSLRVNRIRVGVCGRCGLEADGIEEFTHGMMLCFDCMTRFLRYWMKDRTATNQSPQEYMQTWMEKKHAPFSVSDLSAFPRSGNSEPTH
jgi:hypothetical protein